MDDSDVPDTRVFVSGLPPNFDSNQLGAHFAGRYQVTDARVIPERRIGFVGFRNYTLAKNAVKYFDKSYIRLSKISVQMAKPIEHYSSNQQGRAASRKFPLADLGHANGKPSSSNTSTSHSAFQPYTPVTTTSNKRKRETRSDEQGRPTEHAASEGKAGRPLSFTEDGKDRGSSRLRRTLLEEPKDKNALHNGGRVDTNGIEDTSDDMQGKRFKKALAATSHGGNISMLVPQDLRQDDAIPKKMKRQKKRKGNQKDEDGGRDHNNSQAVDEDSQEMGTSSGIHDGQFRKSSNSAEQVDKANQGGVESSNDDALETVKSSTDQDEQQLSGFSVPNDRDWLRTKTSRVLGLMDEAVEDEASANPEREARSTQTTTVLRSETTNLSGELSAKPVSTLLHDTLPSGGRLFVRNVPYSASESDVEGLFSKYGQLEEVRLVRDSAGNSRGICYVQFTDHQNAKHALDELDCRSFQGRLLHILRTADKMSQDLGEYEISQLPLKKQRALKRKSEAAGSVFNWNSMYMNPNAVLASVADRLGVTKADLIDPSSVDAAVKQAHAETHIIQETKAFFVSSGVNLDAFKQRERDDTILLIKNFPFGTTVEELKNLFSPYGEIVKLVLPSSGTIAIAQYAQPNEGIKAIRNLAYRNFKGSLLYLEKGPKNLFDKRNRTIADANLASDLPWANKETSDSGKAEESTSSTVFVRNLNFATTTVGLADAFSPLNGFLSARVKTRVDPKRPQQVLSMGFGFVEFGNDRQARAAVAAMSGRQLDDYELLVQISRRATDAAEEQRRKDQQRRDEAHKTKLVIKNVPFEATKKDIRALVGAYGQLRSVKLPQKFDHTSRGFAFADFVSPKEAENAIEALKDTHLLGRRLVLEFADEESVDPEEELRAIESKVGKQTEMIHLKKMTDSARSRFKVGIEEDVQ